jgi:hypothetical protein
VSLLRVARLSPSLVPVSLHYLGTLYTVSTTVMHTHKHTVPALPEGAYDGSTADAPDMPEEVRRARSRFRWDYAVPTPAAASSFTLQPLVHSTQNRKRTPEPPPTPPVSVKAPRRDARYHFSQQSPRALRPGAFLDVDNQVLAAHALTPARMPLELLFVCPWKDTWQPLGVNVDAVDSAVSAQEANAVVAVSPGFAVPEPALLQGRDPITLAFNRAVRPIDSYLDGMIQHASIFVSSSVGLRLSIVCVAQFFLFFAVAFVGIWSKGMLFTVLNPLCLFSALHSSKLRQYAEFLMRGC